MKVIQMSTGKSVDDRSNLLEVCDALRENIESGEVVAFIAATVAIDDTVKGYSAAAGGVTRLRVMGALASLMHSYHNGALDNED